MRAVGDAKREVRIAGASGLRRVGDASALGPLKATLKKADDPIEREALRDAIKALTPSPFSILQIGVRERARQLDGSTARSGRSSSAPRS